jgi:hypothetical protein
MTDKLTKDFDMKPVETLDTNVTALGNNMFGCRIISLKTRKPIIEVRVNSSQEIQPAIHDMLRTLSKCGYDSPMAHASRARNNNQPINSSKFIWY